MSKKEFLKNLEEALLEKMDISDAVEHIRYYNDYISNEVAKGKSEEDVISSLQSPRLIAKNITSNTNRASKYDSNISNKMYNKTYENSYDNSHDNSYEDSYNNADNRTYSSGPSFSINGKPINGIIVKIVMIIIGIIVIGLLLAVFGVMTWLLLNVIIPIILVVFLVNLIKNIFSGKG